MLASIIGSLFNIVFDYIFMFPMNMGLAGAALATALSPVVTMSVCSTHLFGKKSQVAMHLSVPSFRHLLSCCQLGISAFVGEISSAVITTVFNMLLLNLAGNIGVAAYGVVANYSIVAVSVFNGLAQGTQPLFSESYGAGNSKRVRRAYRLLLICSVCYAMIFCLLIQLFPGVFAAILTSNAELLAFTKPMLRIYTLALGLFGIQIACQMTFTALGNAKASIIVAVMRKFILLLPLIYMMPHLYTADLTKAVFMAEPVADVLAVAFTGVLFFFEFRKALRAMPKSEKNN